MAVEKTHNNAVFQARLHSPLKPDNQEPWAFVVLPKEVSQGLPRRGRTSVLGKINGRSFTATLEPDGQLSHWLKVHKTLQEKAELMIGDLVTIEVTPLKEELEPEVPIDFQQALITHPDAQQVWLETTTLARVDWIHWITSAKQAKTRVKRINDACNMLSEGKRRVCCFDQSGFYSKTFRAPEPAK